MFQVRHVYEHNLGVVDAEAIKKAPDLAASRGRKMCWHGRSSKPSSVPWRRTMTLWSGCWMTPRGRAAAAVPHDPSVASGPGENAHRLPSRMCRPLASASTRDARTPSPLATHDPTRVFSGYPAFESRFNEPIASGLVR